METATMLKPTNIDHTIEIYPTETSKVQNDVPYQVRIMPENGTEAMENFKVAFELPAGATHHDAVLLAETLKNVNATVKLVSD